MKDKILYWMHKLASVPRGSHHEAAVSNLLKKEIEAMGYAVSQDTAYNICANIPATPGREHAPTVILQAHMDMVIAVKEGYAFDPLCDTPTLYEDNGVLTSHGTTSIGADDGIGIALALALVGSDCAHGPLKLLFTADEEDGMSGATNVDAAWLDADYLVNLDWEEFGSVCNSCAGCRGYSLSYQPTYTPVPAGNVTLKLSASGFRGGHSGITIGEGRDNAILVLAGILHALKKNDIDYRLVRFHGGSARNAIAAFSHAVISVPKAQEKELIEFVEMAQREYYHEKAASVCVSSCEPEPAAASAENLEALLSFVLSVHNGVFSMSEVMENLVECSSNLGVVSCDSDHWMVDIFARSSSYEKEAELEAMVQKTAQTAGWTFALNQSAPGWPVNPDSKLLPLLLSSYESLFGEAMRVEPVHAGLECGWFVIKNKALDCVSFGPTLKEVHTPNESMDIASAVDTYRLLEKLMERI